MASLRDAMSVIRSVFPSRCRCSGRVSRDCVEVYVDDYLFQGITLEILFYEHGRLEMSFDFPSHVRIPYFSTLYTDYGYWRGTGSALQYVGDISIGDLRRRFAGELGELERSGIPDLIIRANR